MLVTLRIPVVDLRPYARADYPRGVRLPATWREGSFVRSFGPTEGGSCRYDRALRFPPAYPALAGCEFYGLRRWLHPAGTRDDLFHVDVQLRGRYRSVHSGQTAGGDAVVTAVLGAPTSLHWPGGTVTDQSLGTLGRPVSRAFDRATTVGAPSGDVRPGAPLVAVELTEREPVEGWPEGRPVGEGLRLASGRVVFRGRPVDLVVLRRTGPADRHRQRALRAHVLRLHAEREYLRQLARLLATDGFLDACDGRRSQRLQYALNQCLRTLTRPYEAGFTRSEVSAAFRGDRTLSGAEIDVLLERVKGFRPAVRERLRRLRAHEEGLATGGPELLAAVRLVRRYLVAELATGRALAVDGVDVPVGRMGDAIGALLEAEDAIQARDDRGVVAALRRPGRWLASFADRVGVEVLAGTIRSVLGLP